MTPHEESHPAPGQGRPGDAVLVLLQNNRLKSLTVVEANEAMAALLGYAGNELLDREFSTILGAELAATLAEALEYDDAAPDFGDVFARIREVKLRRRMGEEILVNITLTRLMVQDRHACFQLVVASERTRAEVSRLREFIALNLEGRAELDEATGLPNHKTAKEFLPVLRSFIPDGSMGVVFAVLRVDRFDKSVARYGKKACVELVKHAQQLCRTTFRSQDVVFALSENTLGLLLFDISRESARVVLNRFRWKVKSQRFHFGGKADFSISISIGFDVLDLAHTDEVLARCERAVAELEASERNALVELEAA